MTEHHKMAGPDGFYHCDFCGCYTNALTRICCLYGKNADTKPPCTCSPCVELGADLLCKACGGALDGFSAIDGFVNRFQRPSFDPIEAANHKGYMQACDDILSVLQSAKTLGSKGVPNAIGRLRRVAERLYREKGGT